MSPKDVLDVVKAATVKGRGGAGFPAGIKWSLMAPNDNSGPRYLICNADEMEPGTFKDRLLMEDLPHQLIEGMLIAAYTLEATQGYIFIRGEYIEAAKYLNEALEQFVPKVTWVTTSLVRVGTLICTCIPVRVVISAVKKLH